MDPDACLSDLFDLLVEGDCVAAGQKARELLEWMGKGGFAPGGGKIRLASLMGFLEHSVCQGEEDKQQIAEPDDDYE